MLVEVGSYLRITDPSSEIMDWCKENLELANPDYQKKVRMHLWTGNTPRQLFLYSVNGDDLILPFGCLRNLMPLIQDAEVVTTFAPQEYVEFGGNVPLYDYQEIAVNKMIVNHYGILQSPAGSGKTQMGIAIACTITSSGSLTSRFPKRKLPKQDKKPSKKRRKKPSARRTGSVRAMLHIKPKQRRNAGRRMTGISTRSVSANSAVRSFIRTAQGRGFAILTAQKPISRQKKRRNALPKRESTPSVKRSARFAASPSGRPTVRRCCVPRNVKPSTADRNSLPIITVSNPSRKSEKQYEFKEEHTMEKFITDQRTGLRYELVGDYYLIAGEDEPEGRPIGIWGQRHLRYIRKHKVCLYAELLTTDKLNDYLADLNEQAEELFSQLVKQLAEKESVTEALKAENQMLWVQKMNSIRNTAMEVVSNDLIYA